MMNDKKFFTLIDLTILAIILLVGSFIAYMVRAAPNYEQIDKSRWVTVATPAFKELRIFDLKGIQFRCKFAPGSDWGLCRHEALCTLYNVQTKQKVPCEKAKGNYPMRTSK